MRRAAIKTEVTEMSNEQARSLALHNQFYAIQKALDRITDPASRTILEELKKEITEKIEANQ